MPENTNRITVDFFHDTVCCWCFNMSFRMRTLADEFDLDIRHRTFVLQDSVEAMRRHWGSPEQARTRILEHWDACREVSDRPEMINVDAMSNAGFDYPHGFQAALACKAAERLSGQAAHWDMFDAIQRAHFTEARNIADVDVLLDVAQSLGYQISRFDAEMNTPMTFADVQAC
ncbi:DsbA family oxidoreductase [Acidithiobacillus thiooxidans]|uniref:Disulfide bond formation protein DsbA n=1 Tax=Acidithiobacillus thiooxidans TaxID=930 RepID=A0A1C2I666_ACITH|nr:DsbA family protein [Acidithiobacillus thiooxidans]OCX71489.1 disulfide bond formation protein DsbA [Acidithiobacillus thiooxidans]OCX83645.1 disulfide bond formation protein DsbA [Acidithiobacillus thiooxidans]